MEKITISICGRNFTLRTDEPGSGERIRNLAASLERQINEVASKINKPEADVLTLVAFDIFDNADKINRAHEQTEKELREKLSSLSAEVSKKRDEMLREEMASVESELESMAAGVEAVRVNERNEYIEYEHNLVEQMEHKDKELKELRVLYDSAVKEMESISSNSASAEAENDSSLQESLRNYERSFDEFSKMKEREIARLQEDNIKLKAENDELKQRLAALSDDGQIIL